MIFKRLLQKIKFWQKKNKRKPVVRKRTIANYKQPAYIYQKQYRSQRYISLWEAVFQPYDLNMFLLMCYIGTLVFIVCFPYPLFMDPYWHPGVDFNHDGVFTISDVLCWIRWLYYVPGNVIISAILQSPVMAHFFEVHYGSYEATGAFIMSMTYWWTTGGSNLVFVWLLPIAIQTYLR